MKCCGEERTTPFCPICGEPCTPIYELLAYCKLRLSLYENRFANYTEFREREPDTPYLKYEVPSLKRNIRNWRRRIGALVEAINLSEGNKEV